MIEYYKLYLPKSKREVKIEVSVPRYKNDITFDTLYFLDGQNAFKDSHASFGRSIRATKALGFAAKELGKRILGVAIYNSESEMGRINEYSPFKMDFAASKEWNKHDTSICDAFCEDFIHTIIPFIDSKYKTNNNPNNRFIYGSSLSATTAIYISLKYNEYINTAGGFSTASFLYKKAFNDFVKENMTTSTSIFLYVGKNEASDDLYDKNLYFNTSLELYRLIKENGGRTKLVVSQSGIHNEATWENHLLDFISFIYNDDITYKY